MTDNGEGRKICFRDLFFHILRKWRRLLCWGVAGMILVPGAVFAADYVRYVRAQEEMGEAGIRELTTDEIEEGLREEQITDCRAAYRTLLKLAYQQDYMRQSLLNDMAPYGVWQKTLVYHIESEEDDNSWLSVLYEVYMNGDECKRDIIEACGLETSPKYLGEIYQAQSRENGVLCVDIYGASPSVLEEMAGKISQLLLSYHAALPGQAPSHSVVEKGAFDQALLVYDEPAVGQKDLESTTKTLKEQLKNFTPEQKILVGRRAEEAGIKIDESLQDALLCGDAGTEMFSGPGVSKRAAVAGVILGFVCCCGFLALRYESDERIHNEEDLRLALCLPVFGVLETEKPYRGIFSFIDRYLTDKYRRGPAAFSEENQILLLERKLAKKLREEESGSCLFFSTQSGENIKETCRALGLKLADKVQVSFLDGFDLQADWEKIAQNSCVVLVESAETSKYEEIRKTAALLRFLEVKTVIGILITQR